MKHSIVIFEQVLNLDKTEVFFGRVKIDTRNKKDLIEADRTINLSRSGFNYKHSIPLLVYLCANGTKLPPAAIFRGVREQKLSTVVLT